MTAYKGNSASGPVKAFKEGVRRIPEEIDDSTWAEYLEYKKKKRATKKGEYNIEKLSTGSSKDKAGKYAMSGMPLDVLEILNMPLQNGLRKGYTEHDWMNGLDDVTLYDAGLRHLQKHMKGETIDPDGDIPHIYAVAWNFMVMALNHYYGRTDLDNRWLKNKLKGNKDDQSN